MGKSRSTSLVLPSFDTKYLLFFYLKVLRGKLANILYIECSPA